MVLSCTEFTTEATIRPIDRMARTPSMMKQRERNQVSRHRPCRTELSQGEHDRRPGHIDDEAGYGGCDEQRRGEMGATL